MQECSGLHKIARYKAVSQIKDRIKRKGRERLEDIALELGYFIDISSFSFCNINSVLPFGRVRAMLELHFVFFVILL